MAIWQRLASRPPTGDYSLITFGYDGARKPKSGGAIQSALYIAEIKRNPSKDGRPNLQLRRVVCRGPRATMYRQISMFTVYTKVKLGAFGQGKDLIADNRAKFNNPKSLKITPQELIKRLGIKRIKIAQAPDYPSRRDSTNYLDRLDLRVIRAMTTNAPTIFNRKNKDGNPIIDPSGQMLKGANYKISDLSIDIEEDYKERKQTSEKGIKVPSILTVWLAPELAVYDSESVLDFIGTITTDRETGEATMNAICVLPIYATSLGETPEISENPKSEEPD